VADRLEEIGREVQPWLPRTDLRRSVVPPTVEELPGVLARLRRDMSLGNPDINHR
jgi:hypothetical protein